MKILKLIGQIEIKAGLHIGGGDDTMKIGGIDNQIIKDTNSGNPYIPGSSIKGKMRSLLEWDNALVGCMTQIDENGKEKAEPFNSSKINSIADEKQKQNAINLLKIFGDKECDYGITRISVGDCFVSAESEKLKLSEAKYENVIDRKSGTASNPRQTERVPAGVKFDYDIRLKVLEGDDEKAMKDMVKSGLELIQNDYLGGSGSRGYGRVEFSNTSEWI